MTINGEPAPASGNNVKPLGEQYSWSIVQRLEQVAKGQLEDFVVIGANGHVVARLEQCMGTKNAELQPYLHSPNDPDNHSLQIGSDDIQVNGLPAYCGLSYTAFGKSMRSLENQKENLKLLDETNSGNRRKKPKR